MLLISATVRLQTILGCGSRRQQKLNYHLLSLAGSADQRWGAACCHGASWEVFLLGFVERCVVVFCLFGVFLSSHGWIPFILHPSHAQTCAACDTLRGYAIASEKETHNRRAPPEAGEAVRL